MLQHAVPAAPPTCHQIRANPGSPGDIWLGKGLCMAIAAQNGYNNKWGQMLTQYIVAPSATPLATLLIWQGFLWSVPWEPLLPPSVLAVLQTICKPSYAFSWNKTQDKDFGNAVLTLS